MNLANTALLLTFTSFAGWLTTYIRIGKARNKASLPIYYYVYGQILCFSAAIFIVVWTNLVYSKLLYINHYIALPLLFAGIGAWLYLLVKSFVRYIRVGNNVLVQLESVCKKALFLASSLSIAAATVVVLAMFMESIKFFALVSPLEFLLGLNWDPQSDDPANSFGAVPVFAGTLLITSVAMIVAAPLGLLSAIYLTEYANKSFRSFIKPILEMLSGIPTVVYGYFAALTVAPLIRNMGESLGLEVAYESALGAGLVMGIMIIPFILSISDDIINAVPQNLRDASLALGATKSETITKVVLPAALPGIMGGLLLATSRAIGETMIVTMAAGLHAHLTLNPLNSVTTVTAQIVSLIVGDQEFDSAKTLSAFALALTLFMITLLLNVVAIAIVNRYRERYE